VRNTEKYPSPNKATRPDSQKKVAHNWAVAEALTKRPNLSPRNLERLFLGVTEAFGAFLRLGGVMIPRSCIRLFLGLRAVGSNGT
jgi:hypothetical protein